MAANNHQPPQSGDLLGLGGVATGPRPAPRPDPAKFDAGAGDLGAAGLPAPQPLSRPGAPWTNTTDGKGSR